MTTAHEPQLYWERRIRSAPSLAGVGHRGLGQTYNSWLYRARGRALLRALARMETSLVGTRLLDVGVGTGAWIPMWRRLGVAHITGLDFASASRDAVTSAHPSVRFLQTDIGEADVLQPSTFDVCAALDVLYHIVDDDRWRTALRNIAQGLPHGGLAFIIDGFHPEAWGPTPHEYHRTGHEYRDALRGVGLRPVAMEPIFYAMEAPLVGPMTVWQRLGDRGKRQTHRFVSRLAGRRTTEWLNEVIGAALFGLDQSLAMLRWPCRSLRLLAARRVDEGIDGP